MNNEIDKSLIKKALNNDINAYEILILKYEKRVYNIAYKIFKNEQDAYDASQEVFIKLYKNLYKFDNKSSFGTWLYRMAINTCIDEYRKIKKYVEKKESIDEVVFVNNDEIEKQYESRNLTPEEEYLKYELKQEIYSCLNNLKEEHKTIIILKDMESYTYEEIASIMSINIGTVKSKLSRARNALKDEILSSRNKTKNNSSK